MVARSDIEAKAREIEDAVRSTQETAKKSITGVVIAVIVLALIAFLIGRKKGKAGGAVVEVYRVK